MLENLTHRLSGVIKRIRGNARLTEANIQDAIREIRMALLEADVALPVVRTFIAQIKERALGREVIGTLTPGQALIGVVQQELTKLMGEKNDNLNLATVPPAIVLLAGLQGAGKTTTAGKLAKFLRERQKKKVLVVSTDIYRPAAIEQLRLLAQQAGVEWFPSFSNQKPVEIARNAIDHAKRHFFDVLLVDTAGRLSIDEGMMAELKTLHVELNPIETLFAVDAMQGQDAVNTAQTFNQALPLTGVILTKMDGDARGGAALSVRHITGKPIKFIGSGEKLSSLEAFHPDRIVSRILGMGDVLSLIEEVQRGITHDEASSITHKVKSGKNFDFEDFKIQLQQMKKMGNLFEHMPGQLGQVAKGLQTSETEKKMRQIEGIINSMTPKERQKPALLKASRKRRIALGSGVPLQEVNKLLIQFEQMQKMMKQFSSKGSMMKMLRGLKSIKPNL